MTGANELNVSLGLNGFRFENPNPDDFFIMTKQLGILKLGHLTGLIIYDNQVLIEMTLKRDFS